MKDPVPKSDFKPKAFQYFRLVEETGRPLYISDHGKPVLKITRVSDDERDGTASLRKTVRRYDSPTSPVGEDDWEAKG